MLIAVGTRLVRWLMMLLLLLLLLVAVAVVVVVVAAMGRTLTVCVAREVAGRVLLLLLVRGAAACSVRVGAVIPTAI